MLKLAFMNCPSDHILARNEFLSNKMREAGMSETRAVAVMPDSSVPVLIWLIDVYMDSAHARSVTRKVVPVLFPLCHDKTYVD